jgi:hypothetical protein
VDLLAAHASVLVIVRKKWDAKLCAGETARYELGWSRGKLARVTILRDLAKEKIANERAPARSAVPWAISRR